MKVCLLFNPKAGSAGQVDALRRELAAKHRLTVVETTSSDDLKRKAADAARGPFRAVAVAGGDGTIHAVVNALGPRFPKVRLAFLPLGTGNDLCRTLAVPLDPVAAARLLKTGRRRKIDVARVDGAWQGFMVNAATGGFSGLVAQVVTADLKATWGPLAYLRGAAGPIADPPVYRVTVRYDGGPPETVAALNVVVANARTAGGGVPVAPLANPEDGRLDVVIVRAGDFLDRSVVSARLMAGDYQEDEAVSHRTAARVEITSDPPMPFSVDGELAEGDRFVFTTVPKAVRVLTGPDYRPDPRGAPVGPGGWKRRLFGAVAGGLHAVRRTPKATGAGLLAAVLLTAAFAWLATAYSAGALTGDNEALRSAVQSRTFTDSDAVAKAVTDLGNVSVSGTLTAVAAAVLLWRRRRTNALTLVVVLAGCWLLEVTLKPLFALDRPGTLERKIAAAWFTFPSGHALRSVGLCGAAAGLLLAGDLRAGWRWVVAAGLAVLAAAVCWSRVYLGVHWPADVLGGALLAAAWVCVCLSARHAVLVHRRRQTARVVAGESKSLGPLPIAPEGTADPGAE